MLKEAQKEVAVTQVVFPATEAARRLPGIDPDQGRGDWRAALPAFNRDD